MKNIVFDGVRVLQAENEDLEKYYACKGKGSPDFLYRAPLSTYGSNSLLFLITYDDSSNDNRPI